MNKNQKLIEDFFNKINKPKLNENLELKTIDTDIIDSILNCDDETKYNIIYTIESNPEILDNFDKHKLFTVFDYLMKDSFLFFSVIRKLYFDKIDEIKTKLLRKTKLDNSIPISNVYCFDVNVMYFSFIFLMKEFSDNIEFDDQNNNPLSNMNYKIIWDYYAENLNAEELLFLIEKSQTLKKIKNQNILKKLKTIKRFDQNDFDGSDFGNYRIFEINGNKMTYKLKR